MAARGLPSVLRVKGNDDAALQLWRYLGVLPGGEYVRGRLPRRRGNSPVGLSRGTCSSGSEMRLVFSNLELRSARVVMVRKREFLLRLYRPDWPVRAH